jgi:hypothetical protein
VLPAAPAGAFEGRRFGSGDAGMIDGDPSLEA